MSLEKIANNEALGREDIVIAANELAEIEKQAEAADEFGRNLAHEYVNELQKQAENEGNEEAEENEKVASAIDILRKKGVIAYK